MTMVWATVGGTVVWAAAAMLVLPAPGARCSPPAHVSDPSVIDATSLSVRDLLKPHLNVGYVLKPHVNAGKLPNKVVNVVYFTKPVVQDEDVYKPTVNDGSLHKATVNSGKLPKSTVNNGKLRKPNMHNENLPKPTVNIGNLPKPTVNDGNLPRPTVNEGKPRMTGVEIIVLHSDAAEANVAARDMVTTLDPLTEFCLEACQEGVGGPECDCHPDPDRRYLVSPYDMSNGPNVHKLKPEQLSRPAKPEVPDRDEGVTKSHDQDPTTTLSDYCVVACTKGQYNVACNCPNHISGRRSVVQRESVSPGSYHTGSKLLQSRIKLLLNRSKLLFGGNKLSHDSNTLSH
ncbi:uncharacterized protein [Procambarus clarkii]|uniref:uncharacterized protein n=1 Tax=Procambarus clarkii TaxID=6728 RepID=UPI0037422580